MALSALPLPSARRRHPPILHSAPLSTASELLAVLYGAAPERVCCWGTDVGAGMKD